MQCVAASTSITDAHVLAPLIIQETNFTIGTQYCSYDSEDCLAARGSSFSFVVPLDVRFGTHGITVHFDVDPSHLQVRLCHEQSYTACRADRASNATVHGTTGFTLPVGFYAQTMYNLRVAPSTIEAVRLVSNTLSYNLF